MVYHDLIVDHLAHVAKLRVGELVEGKLVFYALVHEDLFAGVADRVKVRVRQRLRSRRAFSRVKLKHAIYKVECLRVCSGKYALERFGWAIRQAAQDAACVGASDGTHV